MVPVAPAGANEELTSKRMAAGNRKSHCDTPCSHPNAKVHLLTPCMNCVVPSSVTAKKCWCGQHCERKQNRSGQVHPHFSMRMIVMSTSEQPLNASSIF